MRKRPRQNFKKLFKGCDADSIDLFEQIFQWKPTNRINAEQVFNHPFFSELFHEEDRQDPNYMPPLDFDFEALDLPAKDFKKLFYNEIQMHHD